MNYTKIKSVAEKALSRGEHLGTLAWWSLNGATITTEDLAAKAKAAGLDEQFLPKAVKSVAAFRRAWRHAARKIPSGTMLREIGETTERIIVGLVREEALVDEERLEYEGIGHVSFDKATEVISGNPIELVQEVRRLAVAHLDHGSDDIRSMLTGFMREAGVSIRDAGGVYFVPPAYTTTLQALSRVVEGIGHNRVFALPIADVGDAKVTLADVARETLDDEIRALQAEIEAFADSGTGTRESTLARRLGKFDELRARVSLFASTLEFKAEELTSRIGGLRDDLRDRLNGAALDTAVATAPKGAVALDDVVGF